MRKKLVDGVDFEWVEKDGVKFKLLTRKFLLERGYCCHNACKNCPYTKKKDK